MTKSSRDAAKTDRVDEFLADLARHEMEADDAFEPLWRKMAAGQLTEAERAELETLAADSEEGRFLAETCRPLGSEFQARVLAAIERQSALERQGQERAAELAPAKTEAERVVRTHSPGNSPEAEPRKQGVLLPFPKIAPTPVAPPPEKTRGDGFQEFIRRFFDVRSLTGWATLAGAAALSLLLLRQPTLPPLPEFDIERRDIVGVRGGTTDDQLTLEPGRGLALTLGPDIDSPVATQAFLLRGAERIPARFRYQGLTVEWVQNQPLPPGNYEMVVLVGRPDSLDATETLLTEVAAGNNHGEGWQAVRQGFQIR